MHSNKHFTGAFGIDQIPVFTDNNCMIIAEVHTIRCMCIYTARQITVLILAFIIS